MIILGIILALLGYWLLPDLAPDFPPHIDHIIGVLGVLLIVIGVLLLIFGAVSGRPIGGRRYWY